MSDGSQWLLLFSRSVVSDSATPWIVLHRLPELAQIHVH